MIDGNAIEKTYPTVAAYAADAATPFVLETTRVVETLQFQLTGTLTNTGLTGTPVKRAESIENLIRNITIDGVGKGTGVQTDTFCSVDAAYLAYRTRCMETTQPTRVDVGTANGTYNFSSTFNNYFGLKRHQDFYDAGFIDARFLSTFTATINWRDVTAMIDPALVTGGTSVLSNVQVAIHSTEWAGTTPTKRLMFAKRSQRQFDLTNLSGLNVQFLNTPVGNFLASQTFKTMAGDVNYADPNGTILSTSLQAKGAFIRSNQNGDYDWLNLSAPQLLSKMKVDYSLESLPTGYYTTEYSRAQRLLGSGGDLDLRKASNFQNFLDLTTVNGSTNTLQITDEQVIYKGK